MKSTMTTIVCCLAGLLFFTSCSSKTDDYYPLKEGYTWTYNVNNGEKIQSVENFEHRKLEKQKVIPQKIDVNGVTSFIFLAENNKGIYQFAKQASDAIEPAILEIPIYILKNPIKIGTTWQKDSKTMLMMEELPVTLTYTIESKKETVTVPAGTFENCLKVKAEASIEKDKGFLGVITVTITHYDWYAPNVGLIKSVKTESGNHMLTPVRESIVQLESFKK
ncbi:MAG: hypothetical protein KAT14_01210 [Candidatus Marinimicrobia bacterium]|nr:hypothetical protein [Candidatus Neomarinimicrobiota bacterium]